MPDTIVKKKRQSVQMEKEDKQEKGIIRCTANEMIFFSCDRSWRGEVINLGDESGKNRSTECFNRSNRWVGR